MPMVAPPEDPDEERGLQRFTNDEFDIHMIPTGDGFNVIAAGLAKALGHRDALDLVRSIPEGEKGYGVVRTPGGEQQVWTLTEPGFYRAIGQRQAARVKDPTMRDRVGRFQSWVYGEVLPSIRKHGGYRLAQPAPAALPQDYEAALVHLLAKVRENKQLETRVAELEPAAQSWQTLAAAEGDYSVADAAKILCRDGGIATGRNRLFATLLDLRWTFRQQADGRPRAMQYAVDRGWLSELPQSHVDRDTGDAVIDAPQVRVTVKGMHELHKRLGGEAPLSIAS
ncbi:phage antirepressor KilAC domain-containing protein [Streptomyces sp. NBC_00140]|uniref:phage antirepressor KilAC domain-containing protein n=1 Tax=Streptomyces sp. NBC_00140 TaxID=2975664 RepID=UPI00224F8097|nr:phage antirepressor KilAC domain-containing protein [Streptomyces sp. NBC_00140]MCX5336913.1 phage antirepressor KilAC domain-containing protein [Streptomyces sp. NBC_00140]MCX5338396.1 phage antirepressor KilAC domain-containing protein [Streptomyces sp. NBC_00140]